MEESQVGMILKAIAESQSTTIVGFSEVHKRIDQFKEQFHNHQLACAKLFEAIHMEQKARQALDFEKNKQEIKMEQDELWPKIRIALAIATTLAVVGAAAKVMLAHVPVIIK